MIKPKKPKTIKHTLLYWTSGTGYPGNKQASIIRIKGKPRIVRLNVGNNIGWHEIPKRDVTPKALRETMKHGSHSAQLNEIIKERKFS